MERKLEFTVWKTNGKPRILRLENESECMQNAAFFNVNRSFSMRVNATSFAVVLVHATCLGVPLELIVSSIFIITSGPILLKSNLLTKRVSLLVISEHAKVVSRE